jgi:hypothetical protein
MKTIIVFFLFTGFLNVAASAQSTGGFFNQQSSKQKIMLEQIAGIETHLQEVKKGYQIIETGLNTADDLKGGTFSLHEAYFSSLLQVSPAVRSSPKGKAIAGLQQQILLLFSKEISWQNQQKILTAAEISYVQSVYNNIRQKCQADMDELTLVLTPGKLQMTDQHRLDKIDQIYASMQDKYAFTSSFTAKCRQIATSRKKAKATNQQLKQLYGIN